MRNLITKPTELSLKLISEYVSKGDTVIDATAGNGYDTLALAGMVGITGKVYALDIQKTALDRTKTLLEKEGFFDACELILGSHHVLKDLLPNTIRGNISAVIFNLGYLPSGEKSKTTVRETTIPAVLQALDLIRPNGIVAITMYGGHPKGAEEKTELLRLASDLPAKEYHSVLISLLNQRNNPPELLLITKK